MMNIEIRYIAPEDDRLEISNIYEESWKHAYKGIVPQEYLDSIPKGRWATRIDAPPWKTMVCLADGKIVGTSSFTESRFKCFEGYGEIISIYFLPEYTGKGYGKFLIQRVIGELKNSGYEKLFLWVLEDNMNARRFYEKVGFKLSTEFMDDQICGKTLREIAYVLE